MGDLDRRVLLVEGKHDGHYLYYVRLLALAALERGQEVVLATAPGLPDTVEGHLYLADLVGRIAVVPTTDRSPAAIAALAAAQAVERVVVPDADLWLAPIARHGWRGPGHLELLVLRSSTQPRRVPGVQAVRTGIKRALMLRVAALPRVRLSVLRSSIWRGRSVLPVTRDPITVSTTPARTAAAAEAWGIDPARTWFAVLGNITDRKNLPLVAEAVARIAPDAPIGLLVAGKIEASQREAARDALERVAGVGGLVVLDRMLEEDELDAAVALADCLVLAHSNEGPSGLLAKAAVLGTRVLTAGARSLRRDSRRIPTVAAWVPLDLPRLERALRLVPGRPRPRPVLEAGTRPFTDALLGADRPAAGPRVVWCSPTYGFGGELAYFEPIFEGLAERLPAMTIPVARDFPTARYPGLPLSPILRFLRVPLPGRRGGYGRADALLPTGGTLVRLARLRPEVLICIEFTPLSVLGMLLARALPGRRRVLLLLEGDPAYRGAPGSPAVLRAKRLLARLADVVVTNSDLAHAYALGVLVLPAERVVRATYLTSEPQRYRRGPRPDLEGDPRSVLFVNSLVTRKGPERLVRAFAALPAETRRRARLDVVGDGEQRDDLERLVHELGLDDQVVFHGRVPYRELHRYYDRAHVVAVPSLADYRSLGAIEAAAAGLPSIVSLHDGAHAELARAGAYVVDPADLDAFTAALAALVEDDGVYADRLARAQGARVEHLVDTVVGNIAALVLDRPLP